VQLAIGAATASWRFGLTIPTFSTQSCRRLMPRNCIETKIAIFANDHTIEPTSSTADDQGQLLDIAALIPRREHIMQASSSATTVKENVSNFALVIAWRTFALIRIIALRRARLVERHCDCRPARARSMILWECCLCHGRLTAAANKFGRYLRFHRQVGQGPVGMLPMTTFRRFDYVIRRP
jgi:hypothetical protein